MRAALIHVGVGREGGWGGVQSLGRGGGVGVQRGTVLCLSASTAPVRDCIHILYINVNVSSHYLLLRWPLNPTTIKNVSPNFLCGPVFSLTEMPLSLIHI